MSQSMRTKVVQLPSVLFRFVKRMTEFTLDRQSMLSLSWISILRFKASPLVHMPKSKKSRKPNPKPPLRNFDELRRWWERCSGLRRGPERTWLSV